MLSKKQSGEHSPPSGENHSLSRRGFLFGASSVALGAFFAGCSAEPIVDPRMTEIPTPAPTPSPIETLSSPEIIVPAEVLGANGEYFAAIPSWEQDFSRLPEGAIDPTQWNILVGPGPGNSEAQYYTDSTNNVRIEKGRLMLQAHMEGSNGYEYTSGRINTLGKEDFMYGKLEISAKIPHGVGTWPAAWLLPSDNIYRTQNPDVDFGSYAVDGEMDMLEAIGSEQNNIYGIAHSLKHPDNPAYQTKYYSTKVVPDADTVLHTYGLEWTPTNLTFLIDGQTYYSVDKRDYYDFHQWPYDQKYHLIMNLAMGGSWAGSQTDLYPGDGIDKSILPASFEIASVKYYPFVPTPSE